MILIDANLLLYAYDSTSKQHDAARQWLEEIFSKPEPVLMPWLTICAFLRIATNPRAMRSPLTIREAVSITTEWISLPNVSVPLPSERYWQILGDLLIESQCRGPLVTDAALAALAIENGATLCTNDRDFSRFKDLHCQNPLE